MVDSILDCDTFDAHAFTCDSHPRSLASTILLTLLYAWLAQPTKQSISSKVFAAAYEMLRQSKWRKIQSNWGKQMRNIRFLALTGVLIAGLMTCEFALSARDGGNTRQLTAAVLPTVEAAMPEESHAAAVEAQAAQSISLDFTMVAVEVWQPVEGPPLRRAQRTFYSRSDGTFATVVISYDKDGEVSNRDMTVGELGRGLFRVNEAERKLVFIAPLPEDATSPFPDDLKSHRNYHGEDTVLGYRTVILRKQQKDFYTDLYYAPDLKSIIKTVTVSAAGTTTVEPNLITPGPVSSLVFASLASWSIDTSLYSTKLEEVEQVAGETEAASELRRHLQNASKPRTRF
jgi:hypothetical protein